MDDVLNGIVLSLLYFTDFYLLPILNLKLFKNLSENIIEFFCMYLA